MIDNLNPTVMLPLCFIAGGILAVATQLKSISQSIGVHIKRLTELEEMLNDINDKHYDDNDRISEMAEEDATLYALDMANYQRMIQYSKVVGSTIDATLDNLTNEFNKLQTCFELNPSREKHCNNIKEQIESIKSNIAYFREEINRNEKLCSYSNN